MILDVCYLIVLLLLSPWLVWRSLRTGRYRRDLRAKLLGIGRINTPTAQPLVWFHGVSVGEIHLLATVIAAFRRRYPDAGIVVSSSTDTGLAEARARFSDGLVVPFPLDFSWACRRTLRALAPRLVVLAESELWPNFLSAAARARIPVAVINARMSPRSFRRLRWLGGLARHFLLRRVSLFAVQSEDYADRLRQLGVPSERVVVTGSVKYDGAAGERNTPRTVALAQTLGTLTGPVVVLLAGSTHAPEEEIVLRVFARLRQRCAELRLILVPRHPDRFEEVAQLLAASGREFVRRSRIEQALPAMPEVVLLDTVGELGAAWGLADLGFTGGSLDGRRGGQSMIEPAAYGVPVVFGPHVWNFRDASQRLIAAGGAMLVQDEAELETALWRLLQDPGLRQRMGEAARALVRQQQGATERTLQALERLLGGPVETRERGEGGGEFLVGRNGRA